MSTGDIKGNIAHLQRCLQHLKYPAAVDDIGLTLGDPLAALPILNFVLLKYSRHVTAYILSKGIQLQGKTDEGFVKYAFRLFRDHLGLRVVITPAQFLEQGFAERKVLLLVDVVKAARDIHQAGVKQERLKLDNACRQSPGKLFHAQASPIKATVQLNTGQPVPEQLRRVPLAAATDGAQEIFELIQPEPTDLTAAAITMLTSPARSRSAHQQHSARRSSPAAGQTTAGIGSSRGNSPQQHPTSHGSQQPQWRTASAIGCMQDSSILEPRAVLPKPVHQCGQQPQQHNGLSSTYGAQLHQDELIAAGLQPLPRGPQQQQQHNHHNAGLQQQQLAQHWQAEQQQQQQQRKPLKACLWPQHEQGSVHDRRPGTAPGDGSDGISEGCQTDRGTNGQQQEEQQQQQQQDEELLGTTTFMLAPQPQDAPGDDDALVAADLAPVQELQQQLTESQAVIVELQERLTQAEQQLQEQRSTAAGFQESASARITLLEGRLKFLENLINSSQQQQQQQPGPLPTAAAGAGVHDSSSRSRTSASAASVMAMRSSRSYMSAAHFTERYMVSQSNSPATIHTTSAPRPSPARHAAVAAAAAVSGGCTDWRSAASAAAAAVVAGLTASPLKSPARSPLKGLNRSSTGASNAVEDDDMPAGPSSWQDRATRTGVGVCEAGAASYACPQLKEASAAAEHIAEARMAAVNADEMLRRSYARLTSWKGPAQGPTSRGGNADVAGYPNASSEQAADKENRDTGTLIDKLASRAVEAAAMLEAFRAGNMP